jgi:signal transduction histidine kinase
LLEDRAGNLWVGVDDGLYLFKNGRFRRLPEPDHKPLGLVVGMTEDLDGNIWAACAGRPRKLVRIRDFQVREAFAAPRTPPGRNLAPDPAGGIWIGTLTGDLVRFRDGAIESFPVRPKGNPVSDQIVVQADGSVLAAYEDGLVGLRQGSLQRMTTDNGLPCNAIISFIQDKEKRWWLYSACGVVELADAELRRWWADPAAVVQTRRYDVLDGAQPGTPSFNSAAYSSDGRVWFATGVVVQMVNPSRLSEQAVPAATSIESVIVDRKTLATGEGLVIPPNPRDLQIEYTSPALLIPQKVKFRYRLEGYERDWHEAGTRRQAFYTDLPHGQYSFRVIASNSDGIWNEHGAALDFSVAAAYYQTRWFQAVVAIGTLTLLLVAYQLRIRRIARQFNRTLDARVSERTRIARELHDTLLQSLHGLVLRFQSASTILPARPEEAKARLDRALEQAEAAIAEGRDAVQGLRSSATMMNELANGIAALGVELTNDPSVVDAAAIEVEVDGKSRDLNPLVREEAYRIASEALRNAFKHAQPRRITVTIHYDARQLRLTVRDDGQGIDSVTIERQPPAGHFGLRGMRERAAIVKGRLDVRSEPGVGTEIELKIPATIAYAASAGSSWWSRFLS